ncbi:hypothetical protein HZI73_07975 [Vallitalea pronyensis]|uniref:Uncharacterized protein n=1 Tax=Vallitalea pronyensis TaxID=1348613 RepID=A0A8J8MIP1_9FIRM|nr:chondroitinase family polysaccharide lyase [Vallitalea pronyensis]QUI22236.1 hypothetical protein HZI73_07975 [Vallitalea pronyensis]
MSDTPFKDVPYDCITFDEPFVPKNITAEYGTLSITNRHYLTNYALQWDYTKDDTLIIYQKMIYKEPEVMATYVVGGKVCSVMGKPLGFQCYLYSEAPSETVLTFEFGENDVEGLPKVHCTFDFLLNHEGWQEIKLPFNRGIMEGHIGKDLSWLKIQAAAKTSGTVYLANIACMKPIEPNNIGASKQMPNIPMHPRRRCHGDWYRNDHLLNRPLFPKPPKVTCHEKEGFKHITHGYKTLSKEMDCRHYPWENGDEDLIIKQYASYDLTDEQGIITGRYIDMPESYRFNSLMGIIGLKYNETHQPIYKQMFMMMLRHAWDQNYRLRWYNNRGFATGLLYMKDVLIEENLRDKAIQHLREQFDMHRIYDSTGANGRVRAKGENTDDTFFSLPSMLVSVLLMDDTPEKVQEMRALIKHIEEKNLGYGPGLTSSYKPDGTSFHHGTFIYQYHDVANFTLARLFRMVHGTAFDFAPSAYQRFRYILETEYFIRNGLYEPFTTSHYAFNHKRSTGLWHFANFGSIDGEEQTAAMYMYLTKSSQVHQEDSYYQAFEAKGIQPWIAPEGHKTLTYSAAAFHRRDQWAVGVKGHSRYVYPMEVWFGKRYVAYSMFRSYGFMEILYPASEATGGLNNGLAIDQGFDWRRWPGTTSMYMPLDKIKSIPLNLDDEWAEMLLSDQHFVGGLDTSDGNGVFALKLRGHDKYNMASFYATKTYFYADDYVLCLGSDIHSGLSEYPVETTLFQNHLEHQQDKLYINDTQGHDDFGFTYQLDENQVNWLIDNRGNGYYVFGHQKLWVAKEHCVSRDSADCITTEGDRAMAWLDHGHAPDYAAYAYILKVGTTLESMMTFVDAMGSDDPPFQMLQQNKQAHIVGIRPTETIAYVLFEKNYTLEQHWGTWSSPILAVTMPAILTVKALDDTLILSICDPDLRFYEGICEDYNLDYTRTEKSIYGRYWYGSESKASVVRVKLKGCWYLDRIQQGNGHLISQTGSCTIVECMCKDGLTNELMLSKHRCTSEKY